MVKSAGAEAKNTHHDWLITDGGMCVNIYTFRIIYLAAHIRCAVQYLCNLFMHFINQNCCRHKKKTNLLALLHIHIKKNFGVVSLIVYLGFVCIRFFNSF